MRTKAIAVDVDSVSALERIYREQGARLERAVVLYSGDSEVARGRNSADLKAFLTEAEMVIASAQAPIEPAHQPT